MRMSGWFHFLLLLYCVVLGLGKRIIRFGAGSMGQHKILFPSSLYYHTLFDVDFEYRTVAFGSLTTVLDDCLFR